MHPLKIYVFLGLNFFEWLGSMVMYMLCLSYSKANHGYNGISPWAFEYNPIGAFYMEHFGVLGATFFKIAAVGVALILLWVVLKKDPKAAKKGMNIAIGCSLIPYLHFAATYFL